MTTTENSGTGNTAQDIRFHELLALAFKEPGTISAAYSMFWDYSLGNQIAAMFQCAERGVVPGPIATFPRWRDLGRHVKKGAKAISLCMPVGGSREVRNTESGEVERVGFTRFIWRRNWFVLSQTDGAAFTPPTPPSWDRAQAIATLGVTEIPFEMMSGNCQGYAKETSISISPIAAHPFKTLFHELAHVLLGHTAESQMSDDETTPRTLREVEAESVAMLVCDALGLPGAEQSRGYIQAWGSRGGIADVPEKSAQKIMHAADKILRAGRGATIERRARIEKPTTETTTQPLGNGGRMKNKGFHHTPDSACEAIRAGFEYGRLGKIARTLEEYHTQQKARQAAGLWGWTEWADVHHVSSLVKEQCGAEAVTPEIAAAMERHFPELFADYWENLCASVVNSSP